MIILLLTYGYFFASMHFLNQRRIKIKALASQKIRFVIQCILVYQPIAGHNFSKKWADNEMGR